MAHFNYSRQPKLSLFNLSSDEALGYPRFNSFDHRENYIKQVLLASQKLSDQSKTAFIERCNSFVPRVTAVHEEARAPKHNIEDHKMRLENLMTTAINMFEEQQDRRTSVGQQRGTCSWPLDCSGIGAPSLGLQAEDSKGQFRDSSLLQNETKGRWPLGLDLGQEGRKHMTSESETSITDLPGQSITSGGTADAAHTNMSASSAMKSTQRNSPVQTLKNPRSGELSENLTESGKSKFDTSSCDSDSSGAQGLNSSFPSSSFASVLCFGPTFSFQTNQVSSEILAAKAGSEELVLLESVEVTFVGETTSKFIPRRGDLILVNPNEGIGTTANCEEYVTAYEGGDMYTFKHGDHLLRIGKFHEVETGVFLHHPFDSLELYMYNRDGGWRYLGSQERLPNAEIWSSTEKSPENYLQVGARVVLSDRPESRGSALVPRRGDVIVRRAAWIENFPHKENFRRSTVKWHRGRQVNWTQGDMLIKLFVDRDLNLDQRIYSEAEPVPVPAPGDHSTCQAHGKCAQTHRPQAAGYAELYRFEGSNTTDVMKPGWVFWGRTKLLFDTPYVQQHCFDWICYVSDNGQNSDGEPDTSESPL